MIQCLDHVQLTIPTGAEEKAREFYGAFLGLREIPKPDNLKIKGGFWLELGAVQIHVSIEDGVDRTQTKAHLGYRVSDLAGWRRKLEARQIRTADGLPIPGADRFEFRDPFGNRVEFIERHSS